MKKIQNLALKKIRNFSQERVELLNKYKTIPNEDLLFSLPKEICLGNGTRLTKFGIEILEDDSEIKINLPIRLAENDIFELSFNAWSSNEDTQWKGEQFDSQNKSCGKALSLRSTEPNIFSLTFKINSDSRFIKLTLNTKNCLVHVSDLNIKPIQISNLVTRDLPKATSKHRAIICFPVIDWEYRKQRPHHLMRQLAQNGDHVAYLSTRFYGFHDERPHIENIEDRITKLTLPGNFRLNLYKDTPTQRSIEVGCRAIVNFLTERAFEDVVLVCHLPFWLPFAEKLKEERGYPIIYDCMDDHAGFENNTQEMLDLEHKLCDSSDLLITTSQLLYDSKKDIHPNCHLIRNAGDVTHFASSENPQKTPKLNQPKPIIGYFGALAEWYDIEAIVQSATSHPEWSHVLIGHYNEEISKALNKFSNIYLLGEIDYKILPEYLSSFDVCTIPFKRIPLTEATNPVKIYEYFASGKPVVSRRLPEVEAFLKLHTSMTPQSSLCHR